MASDEHRREPHAQIGARGVQASEEDLIAWCRERVARHKVPEAVEFMASFPRTSVGKIQKHILRQEVRARLAGVKL